jgi:putative CocE/NonD family hydrolase
MPLRKGLSPLSVAPNFEDYVLEMMTHADYDDYWKHPDVNWAEHYEATADVPMMHVTGWYDSYCGGTIKNALGLAKRLAAPVHLLVGPWTHGGNARSHAGEVEFGPEAALADFHRGFHLRWFDRFLKGKKTADEPRIRIFVMGTGDGRRDQNGRLHHGGYWRTAAEWPLPGTEWRRYYFHAGGSLETEPPRGSAPPTSYTFDPRNPVPTIGGAFSSTSPVFEPGAYDQRARPDFLGSTPPYLPLRARADVVAFQSEPLDRDVEVVGPIVVHLHASSTALDTDFTVKLVDVYPPSRDFPSGFEMNLTDGILRARYRDSPSQAKLMKPGEVYELRIEPFPTANLFKKGHRIRVDVSSSNFPRFDVNPNTGEPLGRNRRALQADNSIHHDAARPSHVVLPVVPRRP